MDSTDFLLHGLVAFHATLCYRIFQFPGTTCKLRGSMSSQRQHELLQDPDSSDYAPTPKTLRLQMPPLPTTRETSSQRLYVCSLSSQSQDSEYMMSSSQVQQLYTYNETLFSDLASAGSDLISGWISTLKTWPTCNRILKAPYVSSSR